MKNGIFTVSLDFELYWGVLDSKPLERYKDNLLGVRYAIIRLLDIFRRYDIHATWAAVGFIFFKNMEELKDNIPENIPEYTNAFYSSYKKFDWLESVDKRVLFAPDLIKLIANSSHQEIASHTFSHYYCLEEGQNADHFYHDLLFSKKIAKKFGLELKSIIFPRDQYNKRYLEILKDEGILSYRGNPVHAIYSPTGQKNKQNRLRKALLLIDSYINITGYHVYEIDIQKESVNIPSSRFLRPVSKKLFFLEKLRLKRIKKQMEYAAKEKKLFHLWWHPHNFGVNTDENISFLEEILLYFKELQKRYGMLSLNMNESREFAKNSVLDKRKYFEKNKWILGLSSKG